MTIFELVRQEITARQAAVLYGLKFDRTGRGFCPWHDDGKHPALQFFPDGGCYCHSCHEYGDAIDITAQMLGITPKQAARRLYKDFNLNQPVDNRSDPSTKARMKEQRDERKAMAERYSHLCDVLREAEERLAKYTPETIDAEFDLILDVFGKTQDSINLLMEDMKRERAG